MSDHHQPAFPANDITIKDETRNAVWTNAAIVGLVGVGISVVAAMLVEDGYKRFMFAYITNYAYFLSIALGALFFVLIQHLARAGWSVAVRRPAEILAANLRLMAILFLPILACVLANDGQIYPWAQSIPEHLKQGGYHADAGRGGSQHAQFTLAESQPLLASAGLEGGLMLAAAAPDANGGYHHDPGAVHGYDEVVLAKRAYLNDTFFTFRWILFLGFWAWIGHWYWRQSTLQDDDADDNRTLLMQARSAPALLAFGVTVSFGAFDLIMSLDPHWFSSMFGVYYFAGAAIAFVATLIISIMLLQRWGALRDVVTTEHFHDLGKYLFGFVVFWTYISFSQYMLIWYASIPEETGWLYRHGMGTAEPNVWSPVVLILLFCHFVIPFFGLMSRHVKRSRNLLFFWAVWLLVFHWIDLYWSVMPQFTTAFLPFGLIEVGLFLGIGGAFVAAAIGRCGSAALLAVNDPRLDESVRFENF